MIVRNNVPIYNFCWLHHCKGGHVHYLYEPESKEELASLCKKLYKQDKCFDIVGYTSNIYFLPDYNTEVIISTRKVKSVVETEEVILADCGTSVSHLARKMVEEGVEGFEGLVDLPGTIGASIYGNASCYGCSINNLLISLEVLKPNCDIVTLYPKDLELTHRSSAFKRHEIEGVILSAKLNKKYGDAIELKQKAMEITHLRKSTQPGPANNLGSIYSNEEGSTYLGFILRIIGRLCKTIMSPFGIKISEIDVALYLLGEKDLNKYIFDWNRFIWYDENAHNAFWRYHKIHRLLFRKSQFEIEIKTNNSHCVV